MILTENFQGLCHVIKSDNVAGKKNLCILFPNTEFSKAGFIKGNFYLKKQDVYLYDCKLLSGENPFFSIGKFFIKGIAF